MSAFQDFALRVLENDIKFGSFFFFFLGWSLILHAKIAIVKIFSSGLLSVSKNDSPRL